MSELRALGLSGTRSLEQLTQRSALLRVVRFLGELPPFDRYISGACCGFDAFAGIVFLTMRPDAEHVVIVPADRRAVDDWYADFPQVRVVMMPAGTSYAARNEAIVRRADDLAAVPLYPEDDPRSKRSGTWQTVRMARRYQLPEHVLTLLEPT